MNESNWKLLIDFVKNHWPVGNTELSIKTRLQEDLGIKGDDADIFMFKFSKRFKVNIDNIDLSGYFEGYDDDIFTVVVRFIRRKLNKNVIKKRDTLTLKDLTDAIAIGKLDEEILKRRR